MASAEEIVIAPPQPGEVLDFAAMFGRAAPVEMEIGTGKGAFLLNRARAHPERDFFGIE